MPAPVTDIKNLGPASAEAFARAGITTADQIREIGADAAYVRMLGAGARPHFISYYVLVMGLQGRPWNDCRGDEKAALRTRFDALVADTFSKEDQKEKGRLAFEAALNILGVIAPKGQPTSSRPEKK